MNGAKRRHAERKIEDAVNFEVLEKRQLMSVVNVTDFGAKVNDGADDRRCGRRRQKQERSGSQLYHHRDASLRKARRSLAHGFSPRIPGARIGRADEVIE